MSEKLTDHRRLALREQGIFPRSKDLDFFCVLLGGIIGLSFIKLDLSKIQDFSQIAELILPIPIGAGLGGLLSTLLQSKFHIKLTRSKIKSAIGLTESFFSLIKLFLILLLAGIFFKKLQNELSEDPQSLYSAILPVISCIFGLQIFFALVGYLLSRLSFIEMYQMSRAEIEAEAHEGEMRPELKAATERSWER